METKSDPGGVLRDHYFSHRTRTSGSNRDLDTSMNSNADPSSNVSALTLETAKDSPQRRNNNHNNNNTNPSVVSGLSGDDNHSVVSKRSVWSQAAAILLGQLPETTTIPEVENEDLLGREIIGGISTESLHMDGNQQKDDIQHMQLDKQGISPIILEVLDASERLARQRSSALVTNHDPRYINFLKDDPRTMTFSRRIALFLLRRYPWYNPHLKRPVQSDEATMQQAAEPVQSPSQRSGVVEIDSYPFTHSKRERPSIEKAWA